MAFTTKENHKLPVNFDVANFETDIVEIVPGAPINSVRIVHSGQVAAGNVKLRIKFDQTGNDPQFNTLNPSCHYHVRVFLEKMGPGEGPAMPGVPLINVVQGNALYTYDYTNHPGLELTLPATVTVGLYRIVATMYFVSPGHTWNIFHGFDDSVGMIEVVAAP